MADKEVMAQIEQRAKDRARHVLDAAYSHDDSNGTRRSETIAAAFDALAASWREEADLWRDSKRKGWQSTSTEIRQAAARVAGVAVDLRALDIDHAPAVGDTLEGMQAAADHMKTLATPAVDGFTDGSALAYLSGRTDTLPGVRIEPLFADDPAEMLKTAINLHGVAPSLSGSTLADEVKADQMTDPVQPTFRFIDPGPPVRNVGPSLGPIWTFEDLMARPAGEARVNGEPMPLHWSWSQLETIEDCGLKYRFQRIEQLPQVPQWALIGGNAFHSCVEAIEVANALSSPSFDDLWKGEFHAEIAQVSATTTLPPDQWRASNKGAEGYTWWLTQGPDMLKRYVNWRHESDRARAEMEILAIDGVPMIEYEFEIDVSGVKVKGFIDAAYRQQDGSILIVDYKSGKSAGDSAQLGLYGHALAQVLTNNAQYRTERIYGTFYDARKGIASDPIDLLVRHPWQEYVYRIHTAEATRRAGLYRPRRSSFCGGCSVRYACPVGGA
jgi:putative RecB family exonuclease